MMKRLGFLETKRTPRYSMRKLNVGMASVLLGVTIFGINNKMVQVTVYQKKFNKMVQVTVYQKKFNKMVQVTM